MLYDASSTCWCIAYGIVYLPTETFVYVGHTKRIDGVRSSEHSNLTSGARRVVTAFAQGWLSPNDTFFEYVVLWNGMCNSDQIKAIEQYFMDLYDTRVNPRPTNGITKDIDLMECNSVPSKLNINMACRDTALMEWASSRIKHDLALSVVPTELEKLELDHELAIERVHMKRLATETVPNVLKNMVDKYRNMEGSSVVYVTDIHTDLVRVSRLATEDDGAELKALVQNRMLLYNIDRCGTGASFRAMTVSNEFDILMRSCAPFSTVPITSTHEHMEEETNGYLLSTDGPTPVKWILDWFPPGRYIRLCTKTKYVDTGDVFSIMCSSAAAAKVANSAYLGEKTITSNATTLGFNPKSLLKAAWHGKGYIRRLLPVSAMETIVAKMKTPNAKLLLPAFRKLVNDIQHDESEQELDLAEHMAKKRKVEQQSDHDANLAIAEAEHTLYKLKLKQIAELKIIATELGAEERKADLDKISDEFWEKVKNNLIG